jgi:hypothetical protein
VDGNGTVGPNDALQVINFLNARSQGGGGEGEAADLFTPLIASRSLDNQAVHMNAAPIYGPLLPEGGSLAEAEAAQWIDLSWIDRRASQTGSDEEPEDLALIELMEEFK